MLESFVEKEKREFNEDLERGPWRYRIWGYNFEVFDERTEERYGIYTEEEYAQWWVAHNNYKENKSRRI